MSIWYHVNINILHTALLSPQMEAGLSLSRGARLTHTLQSPWEIASQWVGPREVYPEETPELAAVLTSLSTARIERADVGYKGTQLKALLVLDGGQKVVFKPKRSDLLKIVLHNFILIERMILIFLHFLHRFSDITETMWLKASHMLAMIDTMQR